MVAAAALLILALVVLFASLELLLYASVEALFGFVVVVDLLHRCCIRIWDFLTGTGGNRSGHCCSYLVAIKK
jgi:hypothetical protein